MKNPFKNRNSLKSDEQDQNPKLIDMAGSIGLEGAASHVEPDGRRVVDDVHLLELQLAERGFTTASYGRGPWIAENGARVIDEWAIKHPEGQVVTVSTYKFQTPSGSTMRSFQYLETCTPETYEEHVAEWQISVGPDTQLASLSGKDLPEAQ